MSGSVECIEELKRLLGRSAGEEKVRELNSRCFILGIEIQDRLQSGSEPCPIMDVFLGLGEAAPCWQQILFKSQSIAEFNGGLCILVRG